MIGAQLSTTDDARDEDGDERGNAGGTPSGAQAGREARGTFEVTLNALAPYHDAADAMLGRRSIDKQFRGDLEATSRGEMLSAGTAVPGSAGYVAIEHVAGTVHGRRGTFVLQHFATMTRGAPHLVITVVPDSGTGELAGLTGTMSIEIAAGRHSYAFAYALPDV